MRKRLIPLLSLLAAIVCLCALTGCSELASTIGNMTSGGSNTATTTPANGKMTVHYLDVGQADASLIQAPNGDTILIDSGDRDCIKSISKSLKSYGVKDIDVLVATHPHADHIGCMATVVRDFDVGAVYMPRTSAKDTPTTVSYEKLLQAIDNRGVKIQTGKNGVTAYQKDGMTLKFLAPNSTDYGNLNNYSIVSKLTYGDTSFLFLGDAEHESIREMLKKRADLRADVMKLGHHGSSTAISKELMNAVQPTYGIISCGEGNSYGHPHREALQLLDQYDVTSFRTDKDGTIRAASDGKTITFTTGLPSVQSAA